MNISLGLRENRLAYEPGQSLQGAVLWECESQPELAEVRLLWFTRGKGTDDGEVVATQEFANPQPGDTRQFTFTLPEAPYSFNGRLISLTWAVEFVCQPGDHFQRVEIVVAPGGREVRLSEIPKETAKFPGNGKK